MTAIIQQIANEIKVLPKQVQIAVELLDGGATVPFIARYRKEATGGLDDIQLRELEARLSYLREPFCCACCRCAGCSAASRAVGHCRHA